MKTTKDGRPKTWDSWTDMLGQTYSPGDLVVYASISGRSPHMVFAKVDQINRVNSKNEDVVVTHYHYDAKTKKRWTTTTPSCTVRVIPLESGRGFHRWSDRKVTLSIPGNIVKVTVDPYQNKIDAIAAEVE